MLPGSGPIAASPVAGVPLMWSASGGLTLTQADLDAIAAAMWADPAAVAAHAKLDTIIARITC